MDKKFRQLIELGAGAFEYVDISLLEHLEGTRCILKSWAASDVLQDAGLYHAAYGTDNYSNQVVTVEQRNEVAAILGHQTEDIVYHYCACDRQAFNKQFGQQQELLFFDRFSQTSFSINDLLLSNLCELTVANKTDIALTSPTFLKQHGAKCFDLFSRMRPFLSAPANRNVEQVFTPKSVPAIS